jgi:hypothetical protein
MLLEELESRQERACGLLGHVLPPMPGAWAVDPRTVRCVGITERLRLPLRPPAPAGLLPLRPLGPEELPRLPDLLRPQTHRRKNPHPGHALPGPVTPQRPLGHAPRRHHLHAGPNDGSNRNFLRKSSQGRSRSSVQAVRSLVIARLVGDDCPGGPVMPRFAVRYGCAESAGVAVNLSSR